VASQGVIEDIITVIKIIIQCSLTTTLCAQPKLKTVFQFIFMTKNVFCKKSFSVHKIECRRLKERIRFKNVPNQLITVHTIPYVIGENMVKICNGDLRALFVRFNAVKKAQLSEGKRNVPCVYRDMRFLF